MDLAMASHPEALVFASAWQASHDAGPRDGAMVEDARRDLGLPGPATSRKLQRLERAMKRSSRREILLAGGAGLLTDALRIGWGTGALAQQAPAAGQSGWSYRSTKELAAALKIASCWR